MRHGPYTAVMSSQPAEETGEPPLLVPGAALTCDEYVARCQICSDKLYPPIAPLIAGKPLEFQHPWLTSLVREACGVAPAAVFAHQAAQLPYALEVDETSGVLWAELLVDFVLRDWPKDQFHHAVEQIAAVSAKRADESAGGKPVEPQRDDESRNPAAEQDLEESPDSPLFLSPSSDIPSSPSSSNKQLVPDKLIDPVLLGSIEADAEELCANLMTLFGEAGSQLHEACHLSRECAECFGATTDKLAAAADQAAAAHQKMFDKFDQLEGSFDSIDSTHARIKEIRADVEKLDAILKQAKLPMMEKAGNE